MSDQNDEPTRRNESTTNVSRRQWLQLAGVGAAGGLLATGTALGQDAELVNRIVFDATEDGTEATYEFGVSGSVEPNGDVGAVEADDSIDGSSVVGVVDDDVDAYDFSGSLTALTVDGEADVSISYGAVSEDTGPDRLEILTPPDGSVEYEFTVDGPISKVLDAGKNSAEEENDVITDNGDGTYTVTGLTGNGYGDTFDLEGSVTKFGRADGQFSLFLNGTEVTIAELTGQSTDDGSDDGSTDDGDTTQDTQTHYMEIVTPEDGSVEYVFTTTGEIRKDLDAGTNSAEEDNDVITETSDGYRAEGLTGNGYGDAFEYDGEVTSFEPLEGTYALYIDGNQVTASELTGEEVDDSSGSDGSSGSASADGGPIGGGGGYGDTFTESDADYVVRSTGDLDDALSSASSGDVVFVPGNVEMDVGWGGYDLSRGVTVASNRGVDDAPGALLHTDEDADRVFGMEDGARITGLRLRGATPGDGTGGSSSADGIETYGDDTEVDNCEVYGFSHAGVDVEGGNGGHVHHNYIHHCNKAGLGYGVGCQAGNPLIEYNYFNYNRHSIASSGDHEGYVARYNHFGPETVDTPIDVHEPGCVRVEVYNNVVEPVYPYTGRFEDEQHQQVQFRGVPDDIGVVEDNWLFNPTPPGDEPDGWGPEAIIQPREDEWTNVTFSGNRYGEDANVSYSDVIPGYDGGRTN